MGLVVLGREQLLNPAPSALKYTLRAMPWTAKGQFHGPGMRYHLELHALLGLGCPEEAAPPAVLCCTFRSTW
jgi:hypothetical protein